MLEESLTIGTDEDSQVTAIISCSLAKIITLEKPPQVFRKEFLFNSLHSKTLRFWHLTARIHIDKKFSLKMAKVCVRGKNGKIGLGFYFGKGIVQKLNPRKLAKVLFIGCTFDRIGILT